MDSKQTTQFVGNVWDEEIVPSIVDYIRIPNKSPILTRTGLSTATWNRP